MTSDLGLVVKAVKLLLLASLLDLMEDSSSQMKQTNTKSQQPDHEQDKQIRNLRAEDSQSESSPRKVTSRTSTDPTTNGLIDSTITLGAGRTVTTMMTRSKISNSDESAHEQNIERDKQPPKQTWTTTVLVAQQALDGSNDERVQNRSSENTFDGTTGVRDAADQTVDLGDADTEQDERGEG